MGKVRQDAWSHEDDLLLAETVLRHVREGSTQLNAFEEVGDVLNRTSAACGFRWNAEVRGKYDHAMELAKRQRKEKKRSLQKNQRKQQDRLRSFASHRTDKQAALKIEDSTITMDTVIHFLKNTQKEYVASNQTQLSLERMSKENESLKEHINKLEKEIEQTEKQLTTIQDDYQTFIQIMDRARKMTVLDDQGTLKAPTFKMDKNGNLEQLVQRNHP